MQRWLAVAIACAAFAACAKASDEQKGKRTPLTPPKAEVAIPPTLSIPVTVDGLAAPPITAERLGATKADFIEPERQAWKLTTLLPELDRPGGSVEAHGPSGISMRLERPATPTALVPILFLTRRGDVVVSVVDPADPFPDYHGQGGMLRRPGDALPRLSPVGSLAVLTR
jgi:hypothetical protein